MEEKEKPEFPIQGSESCPKCGCKERIGQKLIHKLKEEGKLSQAMFPKESLAWQVPLFDQTRPPLASKFTIPVLVIYFDVCEECLQIYCTGVDLIQQQAQVQGVPNMKGFGFPQQNPKWG